MQVETSERTEATPADGRTRPAMEGSSVSAAAGAGPASSTSGPSISFSSIISALTYAIDLTEGAVPGHALRTCILGMRLANALKIPTAELSALYYALLLKDVGCSSNSSRAVEVVGDVKHVPRRDDLIRPRPAAIGFFTDLWQHMLPEKMVIRASVSRQKAAMAAEEPHSQATTIVLRCERGANIVRKLGLSTVTSDAIYALDEHWDGSGFPWHLRETQIPLFSRILAVAQHLDVFAGQRGCEKAMSELVERSGILFDPELVRLAQQLHRRGELWNGCSPAQTGGMGSMSGHQEDNEAGIRQLVLDLEPDATAGVEPETIDRICEAFAAVVDAKSPFTYRHSVGVADVAIAICDALGVDGERRQMVRRAALLHDLGKLAIPNTILDKSGRLTDEEWMQVVQHPRLTRQILSRIKPFQQLAHIAGAHHEKLDGSGYPDQLRGSELCLEARIVAVADCYQAITEGRPYRPSTGHHAAYEILRRLTPHKLDVECVSALRTMKLPQAKWLGA